MDSKKIIAILILLICVKTTLAQDLSLYQKALFIQGKDTLRYRILYPEKYNSKKVYPLIIYLHGAGFRGNNNERQLGIGSKYYGVAKDFLRDSVRKKYQAIIVFPQCPTDSTWNKFPPSPPFDTTVAVNHQMNTMALTTPERLVKLLMDSLAGHHIADPKRIYLGGTSLGAFGAYDLVIHYPDYFAAFFPLCGQANVDLYPKVAAKVPIWIFHGAIDDVINIWPDRALIKALRQDGAKNARYTELPGLKHDIEARVFAEPALFSWLFSFKNNSKK
ncbi:carboxylesterase family protein [Mucilaginibacter corticis]|nr:alpha/beta hydrolase-fold protein [Mucilaginibacter corticis]